MREWQLYECAHIPHVMLLLNEITGNSPDEVPYGGVRLGVHFPPSPLPARLIPPCQGVVPKFRDLRGQQV